MDVVLYRDVSASQLTDLQTRFPSCRFRATTSATLLPEYLERAEILFGNAPVPLVRAGRKLRWLQIVSSGFDEYSTLSETTIQVTTAHGVHAPIIAQHVVAMILMFTRGVPHFIARQRERRWDRQPAVPRALTGQIVGIVGYGEIGRALAKQLRLLGLTIFATRKSKGEKPAELDALFDWSELDQMISASDHLVLALPLTDATRGVINAARIGKLKSGAVLHNVARGDLVDESALIARLQRGEIAAALDVFAQEPLPAASPLWDLPNVVITPHIAGHHRDLGALVLQRFSENLERYLNGQPLAHVANFARGY